MKKTILFGMLLGLTLLSCNNDDDVVQIPEKKLYLSKVTNIYHDNSDITDTFVYTFTYNDKNQVVKFESEGRTGVFEYDTNGRPTKISFYEADNAQEYYNTFTYAGQLLTKLNFIYTDTDDNSSFTYTYDTSGRLLKSSECESQTDCTNPNTNIYTYTGNNISEENAVYDYGLPYLVNYKVEYAYDDKFNPYTNFDPYLRIMLSDANVLNKNNTKSKKVTFKNSDGTWGTSQVTNYTIEYNEYNYPVHIVGKDASGEITQENKYEYIIR